MSGWIKLHRRITEHWIWDDPEKLKWWLDLIMMANHKENKIMINNEFMTIDVGERHTSEVKLAKRWKSSRGKVRRFLELLEKDGMIKINKSRQNGTTYKVLKYNDYQAKTEVHEHRADIKQTSNEHQMNIERTSDEHQTDINKNEKKDKNEKNEKTTTTTEEKTPVAVDYKMAMNFFQNNFGLLNPHTAQDIQMWVDDIGIDLVMEALKRATESQKNYNYAKGIMRNWVKDNLKTIEDVEAQDVAFTNKTKRNFNNKPRKQETLPDWAKEDFESSSDEIVEDSALQERLEKLRKMREEQLND